MQASRQRDAKAQAFIFHLLGYIAARRDHFFSTVGYVDDFNLLNFLMNGFCSSGNTPTPSPATVVKLLLHSAKEKHSLGSPFTLSVNLQAVPGFWRRATLDIFRFPRFLRFVLGRPLPFDLSQSFWRSSLQVAEKRAPGLQRLIDLPLSAAFLRVSCGFVCCRTLAGGEGGGVDSLLRQNLSSLGLSRQMLETNSVAGAAERRGIRHQEARTGYLVRNSPWHSWEPGRRWQS